MKKLIQLNIPKILNYPKHKLVDFQEKLNKKKILNIFLIKLYLNDLKLYIVFYFLVFNI